MKKKQKRNKVKSKKKILITISIIFVFLLLLVVVIYFYFWSNKFTYKNKITIEAGDSVPTIDDYLYKENKNNLEIVWSEELPIEDGKVLKVGTYYGNFEYQNESKKVTLVVRDTTPPVINGVKDIEMLAYDSDPDLLEDITVTDNSGESIKPSVNGTFDANTPSEYQMYYIAKDSSGNETKEEFKLTVKENKNVTVSKSSNGYTIKKYYDITYIDNNIIVNKSYNLPSNYVPNNLVTINGYIKVVNYVKEAFNELKSDGSILGLNLYASSGYRSYNDQNYIYNNYVKMDGQASADTYSARAGYSEHQTGLAIDLNTIDSSFENTDESNWLKENCYKYGFIIRYPKGKEDITGYMYEPWHIRYIGKELAQKLYNNGNWITLEEYYGIDSKYK